MLMLLLWSPPFKKHGSRTPFESEAFSWIPISLDEALLFLGLDLGLNPSWQNQEDRDVGIILIQLQDTCLFTVRPLLRKHLGWSPTLKKTEFYLLPRTLWFEVLLLPHGLS